MKAEEIEQVKSIIGRAEYDPRNGFIFNNDVGKSIPFAYAYPNKEYDRGLVLKFITDAINEKLTRPPVEIDLNEVEKFVQFRAQYNVSYLEENRDKGLRELCENYRETIGYQLSDLQDKSF